MKSNKIPQTTALRDFMIKKFLYKMSALHKVSNSRCQFHSVSCSNALIIAIQSDSYNALQLNLFAKGKTVNLWALSFQINHVNLLILVVIYPLPYLTLLSLQPQLDNQFAHCYCKVYYFRYWKWIVVTAWQTDPDFTKTSGTVQAGSWHVLLGAILWSQSIGKRVPN